MTASIGGIDAHELAARFGTPLFVYDAEEVRAGYRRIRQAFRYEPVRIHFAAVCNPNLALLRILKGEGARIHANTPGDVFCALRAGFPPDDVVFSGSNLGEEDLRYLLDTSVHVNVDSLDDLACACRLGAGRSFGLRVHFEEVLPESRMGLREWELDEARRLAAESESRLTSLHVYCGTHGQSLERYRRAIARLVETARAFPDLDCINLGGGFGYDYSDGEAGFPFEELAAAAEDGLRTASTEHGRPIMLRVEPGRALIARAGVLLTRVRSVKEGRSRRYVGVDTTVANLTSPAVQGLHRRVSSALARPMHPVMADVCGCTTFSRDILAHDVTLPDVSPRDLLIVHDTGAYGYCMASHFLNRPKPAEVLVDRGEARVIGRRETMGDLVSNQENLF